MSEPQELLRELDTEGVLWLTLNRPEAGNALTGTLRESLIDELTAASGDYFVRAVVIRANGKNFCSGADLRADRPAEARPEVHRNGPRGGSLGPLPRARSA